MPLELNITSEVKRSAVADKSNEVNEESIDDQSTVNDNGTELPPVGQRQRRTAAIVGELLRREANN